MELEFLREFGKTLTTRLWPWPVLVFLATAGCATTGVNRPHWPWEDRPLCGDVAQVVVLWADGIVVHPDATRDGMPTPGIAGRVYLFGPRLGDTLGAEGSLSVQLYDDQQAATDQLAPREVWNIDQCNLDRVLKKDGLGWGYDLWLPWSNYKPEIKKVTLVVKYQPKRGNPAWSGNMVMAVGGDSEGPRTASRVRTSKVAKF